MNNLDTSPNLSVRTKFYVQSNQQSKGFIYNVKDEKQPYLHTSATLTRSYVFTKYSFREVYKCICLSGDDSFNTFVVRLCLFFLLTADRKYSNRFQIVLALQASWPCI